MIITPELALNWITKNTNNRPMDRVNLARIKKEITNGNFIFNGDTIRFDTNGNLLDGQHRLMAVIQTGISIESLVVFGIREDAFTIIDTGKRRSAVDALSVANYKNTSLLAASLTLIDKYYTSRVMKYPRYTNREVICLAEKYQIDSYVKTWGSKCRNRLIEGSLGVTCQYLFHKVMAPGKVDYWLIEQAIEGVDLQKDSAAFVLHNRLLQDGLVFKGKMSREYKFALIIKAFNAFATNKPIKLLKFMPAGAAEPEAFPEIHNFNKGE